MSQPVQVPVHLRTFDAALAQVRAERRVKLKSEFPPWTGQFHPLINGFGLFSILLCLYHGWPFRDWFCFIPLVLSFFLCDIVLKKLKVPAGNMTVGSEESSALLPIWRKAYTHKQRVDVLFVGCYATITANCPPLHWVWALGILAMIAVCLELFSIRYAEHPYYQYDARKKALAAIDTSLDVKQAAVDLLIQWCDEATKNPSGGYRDTAHLRIATELKDLKDYVAEPTAYKGMTLLGKNPAHYNGAVSLDEDERARHWYAALVQSADDELRERVKGAAT